MKSEKTTVEKKARARIGSILFGFFLFLLATTSIGATCVVFFPENVLGIAIRKIFPFPIAVVDGVFISYRELDEDREAIRRFYESQSDDLSKKGFRVDFNTPDGKKRLILREKDILNKLVEDTIITRLASKKGIHFSSEDVRKKVIEAIQKEEGDRKNLEEKLRVFYGWTMEQFEKKVVLPSLYRDTLEASFIKERDVTRSKNLIREAEAALKNGDSFEKVAKTFSEGDSKKEGGSLGWTNIESLVPEIQSASKTQEIGKIGPIVESYLGYHILVVTERKTESGTIMVNIKQIFTRKPTFPDWLVQEKRKIMVLIFPRRYIWNQENGNVIFRESSLSEFEKQSLKKSQGDPSLIF